jgi:glycosyltransferase involved in cell wall biosynthesis
VLKNGADLEALQEPLKPERLESLRHRHNLKDKFVASYIGTIGMAHRVDIVLEAAQKCSDPEVVFLIAGAGSARSELEELQARLQLKNVRLLDKVPREEARYLLALTDVSIVHLKASPLFKTVIPSKIFEAMATRTPIVLGVEGESLEIIEEAEAGLPFQPENATELLEAVLRLKSDKALYARLAENGYAHVLDHYDRKVLARRYASLLTSICTERTEEAAPIVDSIES